MNYQKVCCMITALFLLSLVIGCGATKPPLEGTKQLIQGDDPPGWATKPGKESDKKNKAFVGISRQFAMEAMARGDARLDAFKQAIDDMGVYGERKIYQVISEMGMSTDIVNQGVVQDEMTKLRTRGVAMGEMKEAHIQHWRKYEGGKWRDFYIARCLFLMPRDAAANFMQNVLKQQADAAEAEKDRANLLRAMEKMKLMEAEDW